MCQFMRQDGKGSAAPRRAIAMVWTAITLVVFLGMAGLVCDIGYVILVRMQLQSAADAAALAAAFKLWPNYDQEVVLKTAEDVAALNKAAKENVTLERGKGDIVIGVYDAQTGTVTPDLVSPDAVQIVARRTGAGALPLLFAPVFGVGTANVQRTAIACIEPGVNLALAILDEHAPNAFTVNGNPTITIIDGDMVVNSDHPNAVDTRGSSYVIKAEAVRLMPQVSAPSTLGGTRVRRMQEPLPDPLAEIAEPDPVNMTPQPMYRHDSGIFVGSHNTLTISPPGIHVVGGNGIRVHAGGTLRAPGVMFYLIGNASVDISSNGDFIISAPTTGPYSNIGPDGSGITIWQARGNTQQANFGGGGTIEVDGIIYMRDARLEYSGNSDTFSTQMVVRTLGMSGDASITIHWDGVFTPWASLVQ